MHISENRVEGSLLDTGLQEVLDECHNHLVTGTLSIDASGDKAVLEIRAGAVDSIDYKGLERKQALAALHDLKDGEFELSQKLPTLSGELGTAASLETDTEAMSLVKLMQLCEDNALSCTVTVSTDDILAEIQYKAGEIEDVKVDGESDLDRIVELVNLENAKLRVAAPPLKLGILSWPAVRDDPTPAFIPIKDMAKHRVEPVVTTASATPAKSATGSQNAGSKSAGSKSAGNKSAARTQSGARADATETSGATVLVGLVIGFAVTAAALIFAVKLLTT